MRLVWLAVVVLALTLALAIARRLRAVRHLPGPWRGWRTVVFGSFFDGTIKELERRHRDIAELQATGGHGPLMLMWGPGLSSMIVVFDGSVSRAAWTRWETDRTALSSTRLRSSLLGFPRTGPDWARRKRIVAPLFSAKSLEAALPDIHAASAELVAAWAAAAAAGPTVVEVHGFLESWALDIIGKVVFGHEIGAVAATARGEASPFAEAAQTMGGEILRRFLRRGLHWLQPRKLRAFWAAEAVWRRLAQTALQSGQAQSFAAKLAAGSEAGALQSEEVVVESMGLLLAGHETTANTATWAAYLLAAHPAAQAAVREEADATPPEELNSLQAIDEKAPLLLGCMYEALRLYPTVPTQTKVAPRGGATLGGVWLPPGVRCIPNKAAMGHDAARFPSPATFDPARYARGEHGPRGADIVSFGAGPRACPGARLAEVEFVSGLHRVLRAFELELASDVPPVEYQDVTLKPKGGLWLRLTARRNGASTL